MKWLLLPPLLAGCAAEIARDGSFALEDTGGGEIPAGTLRIDVLPPTDAGDGTLLAQSVVVRPGAYEGLGISLVPTRTLTGTLSAEVARGWSFGPPTSLEPLAATLQHLPGDGRLGGVTASLADGTFTLSFPDYDDTDAVAIVPEDPAMAPFRVVDAPDGASLWSPVLEPGIPVYGRVTRLDGDVERGVAGVALRVRSDVDGALVRSGVFTTDETGWYVARVDAVGEYTLEVVGGQTARVEDGLVAPTLARSVIVESDEGVEVPVALGPMGAVEVDGIVLDPGGDPVPEPRLRFTSTRLDGGGTLVIEAVGQARGDFIVRELLPGTYDVEIMPPAAAAPTASPLRLEGVRIADDTALGTYRLPAATTLSGQVRAASGGGATQVLVVATELGYGGDVYYTYTDGTGRFELPVADVPLSLTLTPASTVDGAVTTVALDSPSRGLDLTLDLGVLVNGTVGYEGAAVAFGSVEVRDAASGVLLGQAITLEDGSFSLRVSVPEDTGDTDGGDTGDTDGGDTGDTGDTGGGDTGGGDTGDTAAR